MMAIGRAHFLIFFLFLMAAMQPTRLKFEGRFAFKSVSGSRYLDGQTGKDKPVLAKSTCAPKKEDQKLNWKIELLANGVNMESNLYSICSLATGKYLDGRNREHVDPLLATSSRHPRHDKYLQWHITPLFTNNSVYAIQSVSSKRYLDGRNPEHNNPLLAAPDRNPRSDKYLQWSLVPLEAQVPQVEYIEYEITLPTNVQTGQAIKIQIDDSGRTFQIVVPPGLDGGQKTRIKIPKQNKLTPTQQIQQEQLQQQVNQHQLIRINQNYIKVLWHGWFEKQQTQDTFLKRYGYICPRLSGLGMPIPNTFELLYWDGSTLNYEDRRGSIPLSNDMICIAEPTQLFADTGKQYFTLQTSNQGAITISMANSEAASFYLFYRVNVCFIDRHTAEVAIMGRRDDSESNNSSAIIDCFQNLYDFQTRLEALGMNKFQAAGMLVKFAGHGAAAVSVVEAKKNTKNVKEEKPVKAAAEEAEEDMLFDPIKMFTDMFADIPDFTPVLRAQPSSDQGASEDDFSLFGKLLTDEADPTNFSLDSSQRAVCSICLEDLCAEPVGVFFANSGSRVCQHYLHVQCAEHLRQKCCPLCKAKYSKIQELPDPLDSPTEWFAIVDKTGNGTLDKRDVVEALKAQLPLNADQLEEKFEILWKKWDTDGSGDLSVDNLFNEQHGLYAYLKYLRGQKNERNKISSNGVRSQDV